MLARTILSWLPLVIGAAFANAEAQAQTLPSSSCSSFPQVSALYAHGDYKAALDGLDSVKPSPEKQACLRELDLRHLKVEVHAPANYRLRLDGKAPTTTSFRWYPGTYEIALDPNTPSDAPVTVELKFVSPPEGESQVVLSPNVLRPAALPVQKSYVELEEAALVGGTVEVDGKVFARARSGTASLSLKSRSGNTSCT